MATTKKYTVTLPEKLAEQIRAKVGPGEFSRYVTQAIEHQAERDRLNELVDWWESEYGPVPDEALREAETERREHEAWFAAREARSLEQERRAS
ncbi:hypothetical protein [Kitasatospora sp. NPDC058218]|uniref:hypothetical protein n=1 Tax=Kitasatospora sp. NPDC058218 TaxID=3346385 RepID=UPI0036D93A77